MDMMIGLEFLWYVCVLTALINQGKVLNMFTVKSKYSLFFSVSLALPIHTYTNTYKILTS